MFDRVLNALLDTGKHNLANMYLLKVDKRKTRKRCEICSKLTIKIPDQRQ